MKLKIYNKKPTLEEYYFLRESVGWSLDEIGKERVQKSLDSSPACFLAYDNKKLIGMLRIAGDLEMYGYIQDTIVISEYQRQGVGGALISEFFKQVKKKKGYLIGVCPSKISTEFYNRFGFEKRPEEPNGFMSKLIQGGSS